MWPSGKAPAGPRVQSLVGRRFFAATTALLLVAGWPAATWGSSEDSMAEKLIEARHKSAWALTDKLKSWKDAKRPAESILSVEAHFEESEPYPSPVAGTPKTNTGAMKLVGLSKPPIASSHLKSDGYGKGTAAPELFSDDPVGPNGPKNSADPIYSGPRARRRLHKVPSRLTTVIRPSRHNSTTVPIVTIVTNGAETPTESSRWSPRSHRTRRRRRPARRSVMRHQPPLSCFSCASAEYEPLYSRSDNLFSFGQPLQFDQSCDSRADLHTFAPAIRCDATCITVLEPQYFGGILNEQRPYSYVRGCATDIFAVANAAAAAAAAAVSRDATDFRDNGEFLEPVGPSDGPRLPSPDMERLYRSEMCVVMPIQDLWPELFPSVRSGGGPSLAASSGEMAKVCACKTSGCNTHDAADSGAASHSRPTAAFLPTVLLLLIALILY